MKQNKNQTIAIILSFLVFIVIGMHSGILGVAWPSMQITYNLQLDEVGKLLLLNMGGYTLIAFFCGQLATRLGIGKLLLVFGILTCAAYLGQGLAPGWWFFILISVLGGIGAGALDSGLNMFLAGTNKATLLNWLHASFGLGATAGPLMISALIANNLGWRSGYILVAAILAVVVVAIFLTLKIWSATGADYLKPSTETTVERPSLRATLKLPALWLGLAVFFFYAGCEVTVGQWAFSLLTISRGVAPALAGFWNSMYWGAFTVGRLTLGMVVDRLGVVIVLRACLAAALAGAAFIWWNPTPLLGFLGFALIGLAFAPIFPTLISTTPRLIGSQHAANAIGIQVSAASLGLAALPALAGVLANRFGLEIIGPYLLVAVFLVLIFFEILIFTSRANAQSSQI